MFDEIWILIPLAPFIVGGLAIWTRHQAAMMDKQSQMSAEKAAQYVAHTEQLEARVRVLERIVTDRGMDLASEIDRLNYAPARVALPRH